MMLARLAFMTRAYSARVGPLDTISTMPMWSFRMSDAGLDYCASSRVFQRSGAAAVKGTSSTPALPFGLIVAPSRRRTTLGDRPQLSETCRGTIAALRPNMLLPNNHVIFSVSRLCNIAHPFQNYRLRWRARAGRVFWRWSANGLRRGGFGSI